MKYMIFFLVVGLLWSIPSWGKDLSQESVERLSKAVYEKMEGTMLPNGELITKEEAASLEYPVIPYDDRERIIIVGHVSGFAKWCGLNWDEENFEPFMKHLRQRYADWSGAQFAYAAMLHGASMKNAERSRKDEECTDDFRAKVSKNLIGNK